ncbi:MAG: F-type ATPase subunit delta [Pseudomonadota bacterium]|jgi:F-type H+-transporting ATPase subunit delta
MAESLTIARPYAEAAFRYAREAAQLSEWSSALARVAEVVAQDSARDLLAQPALSAAQRADLIAEVAGALDASQRNFLTLLAQNERLSLMADIAQLFEGLRNEHEGLIEAQVTSAFPIDDAQLASIVSVLSERYKRHIKASVTVDSQLIGGVSIRLGDEVIDASVRGKLSQMASALKA